MRVTLYVPRGHLTAEVVRGALSLVIDRVRADAYETIVNWTRLERLIAYDWAMREHARASDNPTVQRRQRPSFVESVMRKGDT